MGNDLDGSSTVVPAPLFGEHGPVNLSRRYITLFCQAFIDKAFVVSQVKVSFGAVVCNKHLPVLNRVHRAWVNVDIWVEFLHGYPVTSHFQQTSQRSGSDALAEAGNDTASYKYVFYSHVFLISALLVVAQLCIAGSLGIDYVREIACADSALQQTCKGNEIRPLFI